MRKVFLSFQVGYWVAFDVASVSTSSPKNCFLLLLRNHKNPLVWIQYYPSKVLRAHLCAWNEISSSCISTWQRVPITDFCLHASTQTIALKQVFFFEEKEKKSSSELCSLLLNERKSLSPQGIFQEWRLILKTVWCWLSWDARWLLPLVSLSCAGFRGFT